MSFLKDYREYASGNEAPPSYHLFASLVALSSIISRRVWIDMGYYTLYPNLYVVLVGPPGAKKSTAITIAKGLLYALKTVPFSGECTSKEKLVLDMVANERTIAELPEKYADKRVYSPITVMVSELSEFFSISSEGMVGFLTDVFDINFPYEHKTKNKGSVTINGPYLSILAGTTPSWVTSYLRGDIITGGFTRRCLFVYEPERGKRVWRPVVTDEQRAAWARVYQAALRIGRLSGAFHWSEEADKFCENWYESLKVSQDVNTVGYYETKHVQLVKLAMLCALSEDEKLVIDLKHVKMAMTFLDLIETNLSRVFEGMGQNELSRCAAQALELIRRQPTTDATIDGAPTATTVRMMQTKKLQQILYPTLPTNVPDAFEKMLQHLVQTDQVSRKTMTLNGIAREVIYIKA